MWRQICHLEKFLHIRNVETICFVLIYAVLSQNQFVLPFTLFCREINFVAIYAFLRGEKFRQKLCLWRKKDKYQVWVSITKYQQSIAIQCNAVLPDHRGCDVVSGMCF